MAKIVLIWELGGGLGHVMPLRQITKALLANNPTHEIHWIVQDVALAMAVSRDLAVQVIQAPLHRGTAPPPRTHPSAFFHILQNKGFAEKPLLVALLTSWRDLYAAIRPDMIICDHSPTAMLAARGLVGKRVLIGNGFTCPPPSFPLGVFRPHLLGRTQLDHLKQEEEFLRATINATLADLRIAPLDRLADLYADVEERFLLTLPELDHFGMRPHAPYFGLPPETGGCRPAWPAGPGKKVFAYLKPFPLLGQLIETMAASGMRCLVYINNDLPEDIAAMANDHVIFIKSAVDLSHAAQQCDLFVGHATHGASTRFFLHGVPSLMIPLQQEQRLYAERAVRLGLGALAETTDAGQLAMAMRQATGQSCLDAAKMFAKRYKRCNNQTAFDGMIAAIERLVAG